MRTLLCKAIAKARKMLGSATASFKRDRENEDSEKHNILVETEDCTLTLGSPIADPNAPHVGPTRTSRFVIGSSLDGINDGREAIAEGLAISKYEAEVLFRHWYDTYRDVVEFCAVYQQSGSIEWRTHAYAGYRLDVLGPHCSAEFMKETDEETARRNKQVVEDRDAFERAMAAEFESEDGAEFESWMEAGCPPLAAEDGAEFESEDGAEFESWMEAGCPPPAAEGSP
jgi:hypothetical protein